MFKMTLYKILAALLDYPQEATVELLELLDNYGLDKDTVKALEKFSSHYRGRKLLDWQQSYVGTFDDTPATTLYLFDHVYGSSRDRGEAMSGLIDMYRGRGVEIADGELPDYLPVFLEYVSLLDSPEEGADFIADILPILADIAKALEKANSPYSGLIKILQGIGARGKAHPTPPKQHKHMLDGRGEVCGMDADCTACMKQCCH